MAATVTTQLTDTCLGLRHSAVHNVLTESLTFTSDGKMRSSWSNVPTPASPAKKSKVALQSDRSPSPDGGENLRRNWDTDFADFDAEYGPGIDDGPRAKRDSDNPHAQWARDDRERFLDELLRHDGRGDYVEQVLCGRPGCGRPDPMYRCVDCLHGCLYCKDCVQETHQRTPLHHIDANSKAPQEWTGDYFERRTLKAWGNTFVIIDSHTIHEVSLDFCGCGSAKPKPIQLLRMRLYPATGTNPRSAATFRALRRFAHMTLELKCSAYKFYNSVVRETNNTGLDPSRDRYEEFLRMTRQWQHLMLLKRAGRAHDPCEDRIAATKASELALLCPACPQPGINLPVNWDKVPFEKAFLYALFLAIDANFRLKRKDVSSEEADPGLSKGWAFFGEVGPYMKHLKENWQQPQPRSTCVAHDTVDKPDRESRGTASSGIGTVDCARHNMKHPNGVGDLQQGERYLNMDYLFFMGLLGTLLLRFVVSYDIACQWYKNLWGRMVIFPAEAQLSGEKKFVFLVPKFHLPAHIEECNAPERGWADANRLANSTSISGPGARRDTLDTHFQYSNWKKITKLGRYRLLDKIQKCVPMMLEMRAAWVDVEASFKPSVIEAWTAMAIAWEADGKHPNPFTSTVQHEGIAEVRRRLAAIAAADHEGVRGDMHETEMLSMGLQLEQQQRDLATHMKHIGAHETVHQETKRLERETKLWRKIDSWSAIQQLFIPEVTVLRDREDAERKRVGVTQPVPGLKAQDMSLWLPSAIGTRAQCPLRLQEYEFQLRQDQAVWALKVMRDGLILRAHEYIYRDGVHGTKAKLRSGSRTDAIQLRIHCAAEEYRAARAALVKLGAILRRTEWQQHLRPLLAEDVRGRGSEEGMSWIWYSERRTGKPEEVVKSEPLRIEWARTRAKAIRYTEEIDLVEEEMRWRRDWWHARAELRVQVDWASREGQGAYARKQAGYMQGLRERFKQLW
ncbi:hypothetical protein B0H14DRAFT_3576895 [Mycena olivaceomarginata]|nr:hypothetical protein B0H14DRAFT_3576895 [Mycena olivaceomarginata]